MLGNLIIVLIIVAVVVRIVNSFNKTKENRPGSAARKSFDFEEPEADEGEAKTPRKAQAPGTLFGSMSDMIAGAMENDAGKKKASAPQGAGMSAGSMSYVSNEGSGSGGSMPYASQEGSGDGSLPQTTHEGDEEPAAVRVFTPIQAGAGFSESHAAIAAAQMRRAIVMKEILDKPVSMRKRRL